MPIFNGVYSYTVTNGGGTINLDVTDNTITRYVFDGTPTLSSSFTIQPTGSPIQGTEFDIRWQSVCIIGANSVTIFGTALTASEALMDLIVTCYYNGSSWDVDIQEDRVENIWEFGSGGITSAKLINVAGSTASGINSVNAGTSCTASGDYVFAEGLNNTVNQDTSHVEGYNNTVGGDASHGEGSDNTISGGSACHVEGYSNLVTSNYSHAEGLNNECNGVATHSGGQYSRANRYAEFSRASYKHNTSNNNDYAQFSKLTPIVKVTDATPALMYLDGAGAGYTISIPSNSIAYFRGEAVAIQQAGSAGTVGDAASWHFNGTIKNVSGTTSLVDTVRYQDNTGAWGGAAQRTQDAAAAAWTLVPTANNGTDTLDLTFTGEANKTIYVLCSIELTEIRYTP